MTAAARHDRFLNHPVPPRLEQVRLLELEDELTTLTGHINAAIARFLVVLEEFDRLEGFKEHGLLSSAHWLHWRCGFGMNAAREKVRVARALPELPQIREAFGSGELSYSKVRAMTRIATPHNEGALLQVARYGTTRHVETLVSTWRVAERARELQRAEKRHEARSLRWHYDDEGCLVIRATLPPEQGALVIEALEAALARMDEALEVVEAEAGEPCTAHRDPAEQTAAGSHVQDVSAETSSPPAGDDSPVVVIGGFPTARSAAEGDASVERGSKDVSGETPGAPIELGDETSGLDRDVSAETSGVPMEVGEETSDRGGDVSAETSVATNDGGVEASRRDADDAAETPGTPIELGEETSDRNGDVSAETSNALVGVGEEISDGDADVSAETWSPPPEEAPSFSQRRADALVFLVESWLAGDSSGRRGGDGYLVNVHVDAETLTSDVPGRSELADGPGVAAESVRRLCCDGGLVAHLEDAEGETLGIGRKTRAIPPSIRRALRHRDPCCRFPGCTRTRWLDGHHVVHWAQGGETHLDNLVHLCRHHHRLVHEGGFGVRVVETPAHASESIAAIEAADRGNVVVIADAAGTPNATDAADTATATASPGLLRDMNPRRARGPRFVFTTPAGAVIPEAPTGPGLDGRLDDALETFQLKRGLAIDARTADCKWTGERMDYDTAGWLLMQAAVREEQGGPPAKA